MSNIGHSGKDGAKTIHIASGECSAAELRKRLPDATIVPFNEAMCEGDACLPLYGDTFCALRARAYGVSPAEYLQRSPRGALQNVHDYAAAELYFDCDMFCAANAVTLLAFLEQENYRGRLHFNLLKQDGSADVLEQFPLPAAGWLAAYENILLKNKPHKTGIAVFDRALPLLFEYRRTDNEIVQYARKHADMDEDSLIRSMLRRFCEYGLGDIAAKRFIDLAVKQQ